MIRNYQLTSTIRCGDFTVARMLLGALRPGQRIFGGRAARGRAP